MIITIKTNMDIFYEQLLELLSSFSPIKDIRKGDKIVLAEIMKQHYNNRNINKSHLRRNLVFSQDVKELMCDNLEISRAQFNNSLSALRRAKVLDSNNMLIGALNIFPKDSFKFEVTFDIDEKKTEDTGKED